MIRLILVLITVVAFLILSIPILVVEWLIGKKNPKLRDESSLHIVQFIFRLLQWLAGIKVTVIGEENVPKDIPVLYIGNHRSFSSSSTIRMRFLAFFIKTSLFGKKKTGGGPVFSQDNCP